MLSLHGYQIDDRNVARPEYKAELESLGFRAVPVVVADGRTFPGFPEEVITRELGLPAPEVTPERQRRQLELAHRILAATLDVVAKLPDEHWGDLVSDTRNRTLGHFAWHIFHFAEIIMETADEKTLTWDTFQSSTETQYWDRTAEFPDFASVSAYGREIVERFAAWAQALPDGALTEVVDTCWGRVSLQALVEHIVRHTAVHLRQLLGKLRELRPDAPVRVPEDLLAAVPDPPVLW